MLLLHEHSLPSAPISICFSSFTYNASVAFSESVTAFIFLHPYTSLVGLFSCPCKASTNAKCHVTPASIFLFSYTFFLLLFFYVLTIPLDTFRHWATPTTIRSQFYPLVVSFACSYVASNTYTCLLIRTHPRHPLRCVCLAHLYTPTERHCVLHIKLNFGPKKTTTKKNKRKLKCNK